MRYYDECYSCEELIKEVFLPDVPASVGELPELGFEIEFDLHEDGCWFILNSGYEDVIRIYDPENIDVKY
jgi:hypothetical protein